MTVHGLPRDAAPWPFPESRKSMTPREDTTGETPRRMRHVLDPATLPASAAWRPGDEPGRRKFVTIGDLELEDGNALPGVVMAYETWGTLNADGSNAVLVCHALTGDSHVTGPAEPGHDAPGWWQDIVGPGRAIDTEEYFVVAPNVLGGCQGSTGPAYPAADGRPWGSRFPWVTVRDQVAAEAKLADAIGIDSWALVVGASMGGHRVLEWAAMYPERTRAIAPIATSAATTGDQIAWAHTQNMAIRLDPNFRGGDYYEAEPGEGPHQGLALARQIAHTTYRSAEELDVRFGRIPQHAEDPLDGGRYAVESYLDHHGYKLAARFDANSYLVLNQSLMTHDVGRDRGGVRTALEAIEAPALVIAVESDRLFLPEDCARIAADLPRGRRMRYIRSEHGHDGFLVEHAQVSRLLGRFLDRYGPDTD